MCIRSIVLRLLVCAWCCSGFLVEYSAASPYLAGTETISPPIGFPAACQRYAWLCANRAGRSSLTVAEIRALNTRVNRSIAAADDSANYGRSDHWVVPKNGRGDCEDYALAKYEALVENGFPSRNLSLAVVLDRSNRNHVVLLVRTKKGDLVLDNLTNRVSLWSRSGYTFLAKQGENKRTWLVALAGPRAARIAALASRGGAGTASSR
jgi:predicted transglutaminase-like cysteine proteinase